MSFKGKSPSEGFVRILTGDPKKNSKNTLRAYSDEYIINVEKKIIFSPGPDGKSYTKDDIKLPINPQSLTLAE